MSSEFNYRVGIDVGTNSVGFCAVEVNDDGRPTRLLNSMVMLHDSGVDPEQAKAAVTRLASSGVARRTRRLIQRRRKRLQKLDSAIISFGWPIHDPLEFTDPYTPWIVRARLAEEKLEGAELESALSIALRHMARHRGWRSPYERLEALHRPRVDSDLFNDFKNRVTERTGVVFEDGVTPAQVVIDSGLSPENRLRSAPSTKYKDGAVRDGKSVAGESKAGILGGKLMQSDNANELRRIGQVQELDSALVNKLIDLVFVAESPKGKQSERAKFDALPGQEKFRRATKAHPEFQRYRIVSVVANLRVWDQDTKSSRLLSASEKQILIDFLMTADGSDGITWNDVADRIGVDRSHLIGTASLAPDGERASSFPPTNTTSRRILSSKIKPLIEWWTDATVPEQTALVKAISNAEDLKEDEPGSEAARELLASLDDSDLEKLDGISLPAGRAAYSAESLARLSDRMLADSLDLHEARKAEFGVSDSWVPPVDPIGAPVGNPAVDRVLKIVNRWLLAAEREWGSPQNVNIEHVRSGFSSEAQAREYERDLKKRRERNEKVVAEANERLGGNRDFTRSDITRFIAVRRQNCECVYCGATITYDSCEMDHIVPRKGPGSTNSRANLVAVCVRCNRAKSNVPFAVWAESCGIPGVSVRDAMSRVRRWIPDEGLNKKQNRNFQDDVIFRLKKKSEDEEIDARSIESVAWMANELRSRISAHFKNAGADTTVYVFRGSVTADARKASGFEGKVNLIGGRGKTRFDRRHHAMDAAVIALMRQSVATTLAEQASIREREWVTRVGEQTWKNYQGRTFEARRIFAKWLENMEALLELFNIALAEDHIPVTQNLRLRLGNGTAHDATIRKFAKKRVGDAWTLDEIDRASSEAMWWALTRCEDFDSQSGLPENSSREIRVRNDWFQAGDSVDIFPKKIAAIAVRGGWAEIGNSIHHARFYKIDGKKPKYGMVRVFAADLQKNQDDDLFTFPLRESSISLRNADTGIRKAVLDGTAEYLGWVLPGVELELDLEGPSFEKFMIGDFLRDFPQTTSWTVKGFDSASKITLKPARLASEGLDRVLHSAGTEKLMGPNGKGWRVEVQVLFKASSVRRIHRDSLGRIRYHSRSALPITTDLKN